MYCIENVCIENVCIEFLVLDWNLVLVVVLVVVLKLVLKLVLIMGGMLGFGMMVDCKWMVNVREDDMGGCAWLWDDGEC